MRKTCLAGFLAVSLIGCDPGSGGNGGPGPARLWKLSPHRDSVALPSDSAGIRLHGESVSMYRRWNGCFHLVLKEKFTEFLGADAVTSRVDPSGPSDSLRVEIVRRDTLEDAFALPEMAVGCLSETPIAEIGIVENGLDSGSYDDIGGIRMTVDYDFFQDASVPGPYLLSLIFYDAKGRYAGPIDDTPVAGSAGRQDLYVEGWRLPRNRPGVETFTYRLELSYVRIAREQSEQVDRIFSTPLLPMKAVFR